MIDGGVAAELGSADLVLTDTTYDQIYGLCKYYCRQHTRSALVLTIQYHTTFISVCSLQVNTHSLYLVRAQLSLSSLCASSRYSRSFPRSLTHSHARSLHRSLCPPFLLLRGGGDIGIENHRRIPEFMSMALERAAVRRQGLEPPYQTRRGRIDSGALRTRVSA